MGPYYDGGRRACAKASDMTWTPWIQVYDPLGSPWLSTAAAALPIVLLLVALASSSGARTSRRSRASCPRSAVSIARLRHAGADRGRDGALTAPRTASCRSAGSFSTRSSFYNLTVETGQFEIVKSSVGRLSNDRRIQALLVAFSFGAFIEGASGFGTPVAICSALLIGLGFTPLYAAGLSLIANTAPVAFGAIGTPILTLGAVTGIPAHTLGMMAGRQLPFVSLIVPAWLVVTMSGWRGLARRLAGGPRLRRHVRHRAVLPGAISSAPSSSTSPAASCRSPRWRCSARVEAARRLGVPGRAGRRG